MSHKLPPNPETWVEKHGDYLFRYAIFRLRDTEIAEDIVQETFLEALRAKGSFLGRSSERTWLTGILKHKIVDHIRKFSLDRSTGDKRVWAKSREESFDGTGSWKTRPVEWGSDPMKHLESEEFWEIFSRCFHDLPSQLANAFSLVEMEDLSSKEICKILNINTTNLYVRVYRARHFLRHCLELNWFRSKGKGS